MHEELKRSSTFFLALGALIFIGLGSILVFDLFRGNSMPYETWVAVVCIFADILDFVANLARITGYTVGLIVSISFLLTGAFCLQELRLRWKSNRKLKKLVGK